MNEEWTVGTDFTNVAFSNIVFMNNVWTHEPGGVVTIYSGPPKPEPIRLPGFASWMLAVWLCFGLVAFLRRPKPARPYQRLVQLLIANGRLK